MVWGEGVRSGVRRREGDADLHSQVREFSELRRNKGNGTCNSVPGYVCVLYPSVLGNKIMRQSAIGDYGCLLLQLGGNSHADHRLC